MKAARASRHQHRRPNADDLDGRRLERRRRDAADRDEGGNVLPGTRILNDPCRLQQLSVLATFSDGSTGT